MKVALICPQDFTVYLCCKWIIKFLQKKGHEIYVISPVGIDKFFYKKILKLNVKFIEIKMNRHINIFEDLQYIFNLISIFKRHNIESIFSVCTKPNIYSPIAGKLANINNINISIWGRGTIFLDSKSFIYKSLKFLLIGLYKLSFTLSDRIWFTNKNDLNYFQSKNLINIKKTILTHNYIDSKEYQPVDKDTKKRLDLLKKLEIKNSDIVIILVGRMIYSKGISQFFEASLMVNKLYPNTKFLLIGPEEKNNPDCVPTNYLNEINNYSHIKWLGFRKDIKDLYSISKIAVLPSYYPEGGYPRAITEPMSMGKAVIAANTKDCRGPIINNMNGLLVKPKSSKDLAKKIILLISDNKKINKFGNNARETILSKFDEKTIIKELIDSLF